MQKNEMNKMKNNNKANEEKMTKRLKHAPDPRGKNGQQIDTDLDNY